FKQAIPSAIEKTPRFMENFFRGMGAGSKSQVDLCRGQVVRAAMWPGCHSSPVPMPPTPPARAGVNGFNALFPRRAKRLALQPSPDDHVVDHLTVPRAGARRSIDQRRPA